MMDENIFATKKDIEMILQAIAESSTALERSLVKRINERMEAAESRMEVIIEEAEERFLSTGHDKLSLHDDKLENHEGRIVRVETAVGM